MKLCDCFKNIDCKIHGNLDIDIVELVHNSKNCHLNYMFFCLKGSKFDGTNYISEAINNGAVAIVLQEDEIVEQIDNISYIYVKNTRKTLALVCYNFYNASEFKFKLIGITGTNGKTTTSFMLSHIISNCVGASVAVIGTSGVFVNGDQLAPEGLTTPDSIEFYKLLQFFNNIYVDYVICEVSAHALYYDKVAGITFDFGIFTNLTQDHLDFFKSMQNYKLSKQKFFDNVSVGVFNIDDEVGQEFYNNFNNKKFSYAKSNADYNLEYLVNKKSKIANNYNTTSVKLNMGGEYNLYNFTSALIVCNCLGIPTKRVIKAIKSFNFVSGRLNLFKFNKVKIYLDFAHTPDGLLKLLTHLKQQAKNHKLISVFGCGGNKDKDKRHIMGEISGKIADYTIISPDNPRGESSESITADILSGLSKVTNNYSCIKSREEAVYYAIKMAKPNDMVIISGKGCEPYYEINGYKNPYREDIVIKSIIKKLSKE